MLVLVDMPRTLPRSRLVQYMFCDAKRFCGAAHLFSRICATSAIAPVTACALGSLNQLAPGRVLCGNGTGNSAGHAMGPPPCKVRNPHKVRDPREHVTVCAPALGW
jgi:hypothetical protein